MKKLRKILILCVAVVMVFGTCTSVCQAATCAQQGFPNGFYDEKGYHSSISDEDVPDYSKFGHGTVYISISDDGEYVDSPETGEKMAMIPVNLEEVAQEIRLSDFSFENYNHYRHDDKDCNDEDKAITSLFHVFIYVMEHYYGEGSAMKMDITGGPDSLYMKNQFWGHDENLTYYVNGKYPLYYEGWGSTSDGIFLEDGDFIDVQMYSNWDFWSDDSAGYHYFTDSANRKIKHVFKVKTGNELNLGLGRAWGNLDIGGSTLLVPEDNYTFYYGQTAFADGEGCNQGRIVNGKVAIRFDEPGTYYLWASGGTSDKLDGAVVSAPAFAKVIVGDEEDSPEDDPEDDPGDDPQKKTPEDIESVEFNPEKPVYTGKAVKPEVTLIDKEGNTVDRNNYDVSYENNVNAGTAKAVITFKGDTYKGRMTREFTIEKAERNVDLATSIKVAYGHSIKIKVPSGLNAAFSSDSKSIAAVTDTGTVNGKKKGKTAVTVQIAGDDNYLSCSKKITVSVVAPAKNTISYKRSSSKVKVKSSKTLKVSARGGAKTTAKITSGKRYAKLVAVNGYYKIKGLKKGKVTVTITSAKTSIYKKTTKKIYFKVLK